MLRCVLLAFAALCLAGEAAEGPCAALRRAFVMRGIGPSHLVPAAAAKGDDLELCPSQETCCTKAMEEKYLQQVRKDFKNMLQSSGSYLKTLIATSSTKFKDIFLDMIQVSQNSTTAIFTEVYQLIEKTVRVPLGQLFADLLAYMSGQDVDLEDRVGSFFDSLFPLAYHHSVNSKQREFPASYQECLREVQAEVRPFGDLPDHIVAQVSRSFEAARTFIEALHVGVEVLNTTEHMEFGAGCHASLVKLTYCPLCQGLEEVRPCSGVCLNVMRGCLAAVSELDSSWSEYVAALERLASGMVGTYNIEQVLSTLDTKISETMLYVMENAPEITKRVKQKCGHLRRVARDAEARAPSVPLRAAPPSSLRSTSSDTSLYMQLQAFVQKVAESKLYYSSLADDMCGDKGLSSAHGSNHRCWNGVQHGEYSETVAGVGISAQKYNPEVKQTKTRDAAIDTLIEKLQHITQVLTTRVTSVPQSDESVIVEGSGSGNYWRSDDEDYTAGSGSGDYGNGREDKPDLHFETSDNGSGGTTGSSPASCRLGGGLFLVVLFSSWMLHAH